MCFVWAICVWWIYTSIIENNDLRRVLVLGSPTFIVHFPIVVGLSLLSIGVREAIVQADNIRFPFATSCLLGGGLPAGWLPWR